MSSVKVKKTVFTCDHCGNVVPYESKKCPFCHKLFDAIQCSQCHYRDYPEKFINGCPHCGYLAHQFKKQKLKESHFGLILAILVCGFIVSALFVWLFLKR